jgi:hypothetical protein
MIIDAFAVAGGYPLRPTKVGGDELRTAMDRNSVDRAMVISLRAVQHDPAAGNSWIVNEAKKDSRLIPVAVLDPRDTKRNERLIDESLGGGAAALAFFPTAGGGPVPFGSILFRKVIGLAAASGKPVIFVASAAGHPTQIAEMTRDHGIEKVLIAGTSYHQLGEILAVLEEFDHVYFDTSWQLSPGFVELMVEACGGDRILWGSMAPIRPMRPSLNMIAASDLSNREKSKILGTNALRFLGRNEEADSVGETSLEFKGMPRTAAIDVHCHFGLYPPQPCSCLGPADIEKQLEKFNIECAVASSSSAYMEDINDGNEETLQHVESHGRLYGSLVINPNHMEDSVRWLDVAAAHPKIAHVTLNSFTTFQPYGTPVWFRLLADVASRNLPLFYNTISEDHARYVQQPQGGHLRKIRGASAAEVEMFRRIGELFPRMPIVIGHGMGLEGLDLARTCPNIHLELCSSFPEQQVYRRAVDAIGADRVLFGTDLDLFSPAFALGSLWEAGLDENQERMILRDNALRILNLPQQLTSEQDAVSES